MPREEHDVRDHGSHREEVAVPVDGQDTICGTFQGEAYALEEYLEGVTCTRGMEEEAVVVGNPALRQHLHEPHNSSRTSALDQVELHLVIAL